MSKQEAFERLHELICDEGKIVTYKTLSRELNVHVNLSKRYLNEYFNENQSCGSDVLSAFFLLIGVVKNCEKVPQKLTKVIVVPSEELNRIQSTFDQIKCSHIYSVQRGKLADKCALYTTDYNQTENTEDHIKYGAVRNSTISIQQKKITKGINVPVNKVDSKPKVNDTKAAPQKTQQHKATNAKAPDIFAMMQKKVDKKQKVEEDGQDDKKLDSVNKIPSKAEEKNKENKSDLKSKKKDDKDKNSVKYLFSKQAEKAASKPAVVQSSVEAASKPSVDNSPVKDVSNGVKVKSTPKDKGQSFASISRGKRSKSQRSKNSKSHSISESDEEVKPKKKKHKRIVSMPDSESDSDSEEARDEEQRSIFDSKPLVQDRTIEEADEEIIPPTPPVTGGKRKQWKNVTKTFEDEEGFFVTKSTREYVTASEESDAEDKCQPKAQPAAKPVKKPASKEVEQNTNKKQSSLTSFFKVK